MASRSASGAPRRRPQWLIPAVLTVAVVVALVVKVTLAWDTIDLRVVPGGRGWFCEDVMGTCVRTSDACARVRDGLSGGSPGGAPLCVPQAEAWCFSYLDPADSTRHAICLQSPADCDRHRRLDTNNPLLPMRDISRCEVVGDLTGADAGVTEPPREVAPRVTDASAAPMPVIALALPTPSPARPPAPADADPAVSPAPSIAEPDAPAPVPSPPAAVPPEVPAHPSGPPTPPNLQRLTPTTVTASSFISNGRNQFAPERAFDGDPSTTWTEAAHGAGDGEWLQANFASPQRVRRVRLTTGWDHTSTRGEDLFTANSHLRGVRLVLAPGVAQVRDVGAEEREVVFDGLDVTTATVRIEAVAVWPGTRWADLCIADVTIEGTPASAPSSNGGS